VTYLDLRRMADSWDHTPHDSILVSTTIFQQGGLPPGCFPIAGLHCGPNP